MENTLLVCGEKVADLYIYICALGHGVLLQRSDISVCCCYKEWLAFPHPARISSLLCSDCVVAGVTFHRGFSTARLVL